MRIQKIEIQDFRGLSKVTIDKLDKNLNLLMGVNGAGKSSVLDAIVLMLQPFTARLATKGGFGIRMSPYDIRKGSRKGCMLQITLDDDKKTQWSIKASRNRESSEEDKSNYTMLNDYTKSLRIALDEHKQINLPVIAHYGVNRSVKGLLRSVLLQRSMGPGKNNDASDTYRNWWGLSTIYSDFLVWFKETEADENRNRIDNPEYRDRGLEAIREAMKKILPEYSNMRMLNAYQIVLQKDETPFLLDMLSDGEKCYITLVCDIVRRLTIANPTRDILKGEGIVLIDEVDLHLHPSWEATVMEKLTLTFPNIQFIVSAHSPLVASHFDGKVYGLRNGNIEPFPRIFGLDYSTILMEYMEVRPENREVNSLMEMYMAYKRHDMEKQAQAVYDKLLKLMHNDKDAESIRRLLQK